jgi:formylglycine-generating enzyme required for sulfatase activity
MRLFISYARVDKPLCKQVHEHLEAVHEVWYDKRLHAGMDWWQEIQERLEWCEGFVYLLSPESVKSEYCQKEYAIAVESGKHIFPVLIQARTEIPESLSHLHYADLSEGMEDIITLMNALTIAERRQRKPAPPPVKPSVKPDRSPQDTTPTQALAKAADALEEDNFDNAVFIIKQALEKKPKGRVQRLLQGMLQEAEESLEKQMYLREAAREYAPIRELIQRKATQAMGCAELLEFQRDFPDYDPDNLADICADSPPNVGAERVPPVAPTPPKTPSKPTSLSLMPAPFDWVAIPGKGYSIAKYPITNAQFAKFIEAGGYQQQKWWTSDGWQQREEDGWTQPRYWNDNKWNGAEQPVVGVSWYEAVAFCLWLSETAGERIMLPTEQQWQYAAQGDDGRTYPWGNDWDCQRCNNSVSPCDSNVTTSVTQFEGKGNSPFGVVDMAGNVWEWCLTGYDTGSQDKSGTDVRVLRGGSWYNGDADFFRCDFRYRDNPHGRDFDYGFRVSRS